MSRPPLHHWAIRMTAAVLLALLALLLAGCVRRSIPPMPEAPTATAPATAEQPAGPTVEQVESALGDARARVAALEAQLEAAMEAERRARLRWLVTVSYWIAGIGLLAGVAGGILLAIGVSRGLGRWLLIGGGMALALGLVAAQAIPAMAALLAPVAIVITVLAVGGLIWVVWRQRDVVEEVSTTGVEAMEWLRAHMPEVHGRIREHARFRHEQRPRLQREIDQVIQPKQELMRGTLAPGWTAGEEAAWSDPDEIPTARWNEHG